MISRKAIHPNPFRSILSILKRPSMASFQIGRIFNFQTSFFSLLNFILFSDEWWLIILCISAISQPHCPQSSAVPFCPGPFPPSIWKKKLENSTFTIVENSDDSYTPHLFCNNALYYNSVAIGGSSAPIWRFWTFGDVYKICSNAFLLWKGKLF